MKNNLLSNACMACLGCLLCTSTILLERVCN